MQPRPTKWIKRNDRPEPLLSRSVTNGNTPSAQQNQSFAPITNQPISAFRATSNMNLSVAANAASGVLFQNVQFDLANEYNPGTSTFSPRTAGVYSLNASVEFQANANVGFNLEVVFLVNQDVVGGGNNQFQAGNHYGNSSVKRRRYGDSCNEEYCRRSHSSDYENPFCSR